MPTVVTAGLMNVLYGSKMVVAVPLVLGSGPFRVVWIICGWEGGGCKTLGGDACLGGLI